MLLPDEFLVHPRTAERLYPLGVTKRGNPIWPVMGAEDDPPKPDDDPPKPPADPVKDDAGFPAGTPLAEMTGDQREAYWKHQSRKHEQRLKDLGDVDDIVKKAGQYDALAKASQTEQERAVEAAKAEARAEERKASAPRLVSAEFRAQAAGRLTADQIRELTEDLDMTKYLTDKGEVDVDRVARKVDALAPKNDDEKKTRKRPDLGQGRRDQTKEGGIAAGRDMYASRHPARTTATT